MKVKLSDAFELQMGKTPDRSDSSCWSGAHKWVSIADLSKADKYIIDTKETISDTGVAKSGIKVVPKGTVIMSFKLSIGKTAITTEDLYTNEAIMAFIDKGIYEIDTNYIYHLFASKDWNEGTNKAVLGLTLNKATLSQVEIEIPSIAEQKQVVEVLDKVDELISLRKKQLQKLDDLIKSRFVEMFGDPMTNNKEYDLKTFGDLFELNAGGTPSKSCAEYWDGGTISWIGSNMCQNAFIYQNDGSYITEAGYKHSSAKIFSVDTVLIALVGATIGKTALLKFETTTNQNVLGIRGIREAGYTPEFVFYYTQGLYGKFLSLGDGSFAMASKRFISELPIPIVGIGHQENFSSFVKQANNVKMIIQQQLVQV